MKLTELRDLIVTAKWFSRIGRFEQADDAIPLGSVASDDRWSWLPSSREQRDPIHGDSNHRLADELGRAHERKEAELDAAKATLKSLRPIEDRHPDLIDGPYDFTPAAKSAAQYAARMAAREIVVEKCGFWCSVIQLYNQGYWPCGLTADGTLIVH